MNLQLGSEVFTRTYTVPSFGRDGLMTRDPKCLVLLGRDPYGVQYGANRLHLPDVMIEWLVMRRCRIPVDEAKRLCTADKPTMVVVVRRQMTVSLTGGGSLGVDLGSQLEFAYGAGLIRATTAAGNLRYGGEGEARGSGAGGCDHRSQRPLS